MDAFELNTKSVPLPKIGDIRLPRNQWYFHHGADHANDAHDTASGGQSESSTSQTRDAAHVTSGGGGGSGGGAAVSWRTIVVFFVVIDALWLVSRLARAYATARLILYGAPVFIDADSSAGRKAGDFALQTLVLSFLKI